MKKLLRMKQIDLKCFELSNKAVSDFSSDYDAKSLDTNQIFSLSKFSLSKTSYEYLINTISSYSMLKSPLILHFYGFNLQNKKISILTEKAANGSLNKVIELERQGQIIPGWNNTKKLINIYGIASGMAYLHSKNIIHKFLKTSHVYLDEHLFPKIKLISEIPHIDIINQSVACVYQERENFLYLAPEFIEDKSINSKKIDVYSFSIILLKILVDKYEFPLENVFKTMRMVQDGSRPMIISAIPSSYRKLIEACWNIDPKKRPIFDEIVSLIKNDKRFITDIEANEEEFYEYVKLIEEEYKDDPFKNFPKVNIDFDQYEKMTKKHFSLKIPQASLDEYKLKEQIGKGSFGKVYKVYDKKTGDSFAVKISIKYVDECNDDEINSLTREIKIISNLSSPTVVKFIGYSTFDFDDKVRPTIITEILQNGSLGSLLKNVRNGLADNSWTETKKLINIYGIAVSMAYLHSLDIIHRDLKPDNVFLDDYLYPKLGDFGLSKSLSEQLINESSIPSSYYKGTISYMSPEILDSYNYTKAADVYAYSLIVYEVLSNERPFNGLDYFKLLAAVSSGRRPEFNFPILNCYKELIKKCWSQNPSERPTFDEIVHHLETNKEFITDQVDENEFYDYIELVRGKIPENNEINQPNKKVEKIRLKSVKNTKKDEELYKSVLNDKYLNLSLYEKLKLVQKSGIYKIYQVRNLETGDIFAGKFSSVEIDQLTKDEIINLSREVNIISGIKHPSFLKFVGYSPYNYKNQQKPVIFTEFPPNMTLSKVLQLEREGHQISLWNETTKLIIIYGIASGMEFLHSHQILHRDLNPESIFLDDHLFPKIGNFSFLTKKHTMQTMTYQSAAQIKGNPNYSAPEILMTNDYSKASDVYSFALIVFEIILNEVPFKNINNLLDLINNIGKKGKRPSFSKSIPDCYRELIESCWNQNPENRPSFEEITLILTKDKRFITDEVNKENYMAYVKNIESFCKEFNSTNKLVDYKTIIENKSKIDECDNHQANSQENKDQENNEDDRLNVDDQINSQNNLPKIQEVVDDDHINHKESLDIYDENNEDDRLNVDDQINSQNNLTKIQEVVDDDHINHKESLDIYEKNNKNNQINVDNQVKSQSTYQEEDNYEIEQTVSFYIKEAEHGNIEAQEYLAKKYIAENDTESIYLYINMLIKSGNSTIPIDYARNLFNLKHYEQAFNYFSLISQSNHPIANYFIGIMKFHGLGCKENKDESYKILKHLSDNGIERATEFLEIKFNDD